MNTALSFAKDGLASIKDAVLSLEIGGQIAVKDSTDLLAKLLSDAPNAATIPEYIQKIVSGAANHLVGYEYGKLNMRSNSVTVYNLLVLELLDGRVLIFRPNRMTGSFTYSGKSKGYRVSGINLKRLPTINLVHTVQVWEEKTNKMPISGWKTSPFTPLSIPTNVTKVTSLHIRQTTNPNSDSFTREIVVV